MRRKISRSRRRLGSGMGEEKMAGADGVVLWRANLGRGVVGPSWTILKASSALLGRSWRVPGLFLADGSPET